MGKTLGEMSPEERRAATERAMDKLQAELIAAAPEIGRILEEAEEDAGELLAYDFIIGRAARHAASTLMVDLIANMTRHGEDPTDKELFGRRKAEAIAAAHVELAHLSVTELTVTEPGRGRFAH